MKPTLEANRRTVAQSIGGVLIGAAGGGIGMIATQTPRASASLSVGSISVDNAEKQLEDGEQVTDVVLALNCLWQYQIDPAPEAWELELAVGPDSEVIAGTQAGGLSKQSDSGEATLRGSLLDAGSYDGALFTPEKGKTVTIEVPIALTVTFYRDGDAIESATESVTKTVTVHGPPLETQVGVGASGSFTVVVS